MHDTLTSLPEDRSHTKLQLKEAKFMTKSWKIMAELPDLIWLKCANAHPKGNPG
jgi:hypothetical protein